MTLMLRLRQRLGRHAAGYEVASRYAGHIIAAAEDAITLKAELQPPFTRHFLLRYLRHIY